METQVTFQRETGYLRVTCCGPFPSTTYREILDSILRQAADSGDTRVLLDGRALSAPTQVDRFDVGVAVAELFRGRIKLAVLFPRHLITKLAETVAVNRGASVLVVSDEEDALRWLVGKNA